MRKRDDSDLAKEKKFEIEAMLANNEKREQLWNIYVSDKKEMSYTDFAASL